MVQSKFRKALAREIRQRRGDLSQRDFAQKIGVAQSTVMRIENESQNVTIDTLEHLCKRFKCSLTELIPVQPAKKN